VSIEAHETLIHIQTFARLIRNISIEDVQALATEIDLIEATLPMLDPTAWMRIANTEGGHKELVQAFLKFRRTVEELAVPV